MREIVVGARQTNAGVQTLAVWFRFPVIAARQPYYQHIQGAVAPLAPGDYAAADSAEVTALQNGQWIERSNFLDVIDPTSSIPQIETRLQNIYAAASTAQKAADDSALANWASSWDGATWTLKSA